MSSASLLRSLSRIAVLRPGAAPQLLLLLGLRLRPPPDLRPSTAYVAMAGTSSTTQPRHTNRLASEHSPYLLQHAHNPVDWYPWGEEAFQEARRKDVPIFLSIGYSTCHWCHVMEVESFENEEVAELLNKWFVSIKVDREERPDIDKVYMTYVSALYGGGGWPLNVFLSPSLMPLMGGTYFHPDDKHGRPGFKTVLRKVKEAWESKKIMLEESGSTAIQQLSEALAATAKNDKMSDKTAQESVIQCFKQLADSYDPKFGGFGSAPKFPRPVEVCLLLYHSKKLTEMKAQSEANSITKMVCHTLQCMARGGIHDHLGGGFHRYSVDECWHVPHFEKMLYDQGQITNLYLDAFSITKDTFYSSIARDILEYLRREMIGNAGEIFSAEDADSAEHQNSVRKKEGAFYVWTKEEVEETLGDNAKLFEDHYYLKLSGNCDLSRRSDPHEEFKGKNVLIERALIEGKDIQFMAEKWGKSVDEYLHILGECRKKLFHMRSTRPRPHLDDKVIVSWNGLAIGAFARASRILKAEPTGTMHYFPVDERKPSEYLGVAEKAANFIRNKLYDQTTHRLKHSFRNGPSKAPAFLDDYAFLIFGLLDLYEYGGCTEWLSWAIELQATQDTLFLDKEGGGYFNTPGEDPSVLLRVKEDHDGAEPSGNSVSAINLIRLSSMVASPRSDDYIGTAEHLLAVFEPRLKDQSIAVPLMCCAADMAHFPSRKQVVLVGDKASAEFTDMATVVFASYDPNRTVILIDPDNEGDMEFWGKHNENIAQMARGHSKHMPPVAHVCQDFVCSPPVSGAAMLSTLLDKSAVS